MSQQTTLSKKLQDLQEFLDAGPSLDKPIQPLPNGASKIPSYLSFYDCHVDASLGLQDVHVSGPLTARFAAITESRKAKLREQDLPPTAYNQGRFPTATRRLPRNYLPSFDSDLPSRDYSSGTPVFAGSVASTIYLSPHLPDWRNILLWWKITQGHVCPLVDDRPGLILNDSEDPLGVWHTLPSDIQRNIIAAKLHTPAGCIFQFYDDPLIGEKILREMDGFTNTQLGGQSEGSVTGFPPPEPAPFGDQENSAVVKQLISPPRSRKRKAGVKTFESRKKARVSKPRSFTEVSVRISEKQPNVRERDRTTILLRHAWARAVATNSSFIVFNCGNFERIGIRDRENRLLHLTGMIPVHKTQKPGYFAVMTGLYLAILEDVFTRIPKRVPRRSKWSLSRPQPVTRSRLAMMVELKTRRLALVSMNYDGLNSSSPSAFVRCEGPPLDGEKDERAYDPSEYILITITSEIARGNTGIVHTARLDLVPSKGAIQSMNAIVKFAMGPDQCRRLKKEMSAYTELSLSVTEGIPRIFGLFEDVKHDALAMIMEHVGESLRTLFPDAFRGPRKPVVPLDLRQKYARILESIHAAGYVHRDIRAENLTMDDRRNVFFIDFDRARRIGHPIPQEKKDKEFELLEFLLNGRSNDALSPTSTQRAREEEQARLEYERQTQEQNTRSANNSRVAGETSQTNIRLNEDGTLDMRPRCVINGVETFAQISHKNKEPGAKRVYIINGVEYEEVGSSEEETDTDTSGEGSSKAEEGSETETEGPRTARRDEGGTNAEDGDGEPES